MLPPLVLRTGSNSKKVVATSAGLNIVVPPQKPLRQVTHHILFLGLFTLVFGKQMLVSKMVYLRDQPVTLRAYCAYVFQKV